MTRTSAGAARTVAAPSLLLAAAAVLLLTNDTPSSEVAGSVAGAAAGRPGAVQQAVALVSGGGLLLLAALLALAAWRARGRGPRGTATALLGAAGVVLALGVSEALKAVVEQDRPCRTVPGLRALVECPPVGDWSLPSNHATLAAALATALVWLAPRRWPEAVACALLVAAARVALGVHYPHDVVDGLVVGVLVASTTVLVLRRPVTRLVASCAGVPVLGPLLLRR